MTPRVHSKSSNCESGQAMKRIKADRRQRRLYRDESEPGSPQTLHLDLNIGPAGQIEDDDHEDVLPI